MIEIVIDGRIGRNVNSKRIKAELAKANGQRVRVRISSEGGDVMEGISIFNALEEHANKFGVEGVIEGPCYSMGAVISATCSTLQMKENTLLMFHNVKASGSGIDVNNIDGIKERLVQQQELLVKTLATRMGKTQSEVSNFLSNEKFLTPNEALSLGLIDGIIPVRRGRMSLLNLFGEETPPDHIVEYVNSFNERSHSMALRDLASDLKLEINNLNEDTADDVIETAVKTEFNNLTAHIATLERSLAEEKAKKAPAKDTDKPEPVITMTMVNMAQRYRETAIDSLVGTKLTPAAAQWYKNQYCSEEAARQSLADDNGAAVFENVLEGIKKNDDVLTTGEKSRGQVEPVPKGNESMEMLSKNMEKLFASNN